MSATTAAELVAQAKTDIENLDADRFAKEIDAGAVVVDLREADELVGGTIPGAINIPRGMLEFRADPTSPYHDDRLEPSGRTLLYCASGGRSALGASALQALGYADVAHLDGGFKAWSEAGQRIE